MLLDALSSAFCGTICLAAVVIHILSSRHINALVLPGYVRTGFFLIALTMVQRAVDFALLATDPRRAHQAGHVDVWGVVAGFSVAYTLASYAWAAFARRASVTAADADAQAPSWADRIDF